MDRPQPGLMNNEPPPPDAHDLWRHFSETYFSLRLGLAEGSFVPPEEEQLRRNFHILQLMDRLSLAFCSTTIPFPRVDNIMPPP